MLAIDGVLPQLLAELARHRALVLIAPPGAGKTTRVPPALLEAPWLGAGQRVLMLEPRRLAARAAARRIAAERGEAVGGTVGFRVRGESRTSAATRIEVVTEGILIRMLRQDPALEGVGAVLFDEFHERSLAADTGLALVLGAAMVLRDDLRVLVMSATLDGEAVAGLLGGAPVIRSEARQHPVETRFAPVLPRRTLEAHLAAMVRDALEHDHGSVLVFLPGAREIHRVADLLEGHLPADVVVRPLFGALPPAEQDAAIAPPRPGERKVVLATNVAETSITIDGVRVVVDSGLERVPRFSPRTGMTRLETARITRASADQRRGRAGRTEPGVAIRCWSAADDIGLVPRPRAEILDADLAPLALDLAAAGFGDPAELPWLDPPPAAAFAVGRELLKHLGALDAEGRLTAHGEAMADFGAHPRMAHLLLRARELGRASVARAAALAALLDERDILRGEGRAPPSDLRLRLDAVERDLDHGMLAGASLDRGGLARVREAARDWTRRVDAPGGAAGEAEEAGALLAIGWPDRVARRREAAGRFLTVAGRGVRLHGDDPLAQEEWLVVPALDDTGAEARALLAAPLDADAVARLVADGASSDEVIGWDERIDSVRAVRRDRLGAIVLGEHPLHDADAAAVTAALLDGIRRQGLALLPWTDELQRLRQRLAFLHHHDPSWPDVGDAHLLATLEQWLAPFVVGIRRPADLAAGALRDALLSPVDWAQRADLDRLAPERLSVPSGSRIAIDYGDPVSPVLAVRLQEVFGLLVSPRIMADRVPVLMQLLSPARRPVQVTADLASFWREGYFDVRRDLRGRYPKHHWPEDPLTAEALRGVKRRTES